MSSVDDAVWVANLSDLGEEEKEEEEEKEKKRPFQAPSIAAIRTHEAKFPFFGANPLQQQAKSPLATLRAVSTHTHTHTHTRAPSINNNNKQTTTTSTYKGKDPICNGCSQMVKRKSLRHGGGGPGSGEGLHAILTSWRLSSTSDTWPWVWLAARGAGGEGQGGLHVIVADGKQALDAVKERQQNNKGQQQENIVVIGQTRGEVTLAEFEERGAAVVEGGKVEEVDPVHGIILLDDERLVEMSSIEFVHLSSKQPEA
jgi:hypothetical protein